jgi:hypothetical protein
VTTEPEKPKPPDEGEGSTANTNADVTLGRVSHIANAPPPE